MSGLLSIYFKEQHLGVLKLISEGFSNQEIGDKIFASKRTVEGIRSSMLLKTQSRNTAQLVAFGFRHGLLV